MPPPAVLDDPPRAIVHVGRLMLARGMTDVAGGNISVRLGERIWMTPRYAGHRWHWQLAPDDILELDRGGRRLAGSHEVSRDVAVHLAVYDAAPAAGAVVHAHAPHALAFAAAGVPIPPAIEAAEVLGAVPVVTGAEVAGVAAAMHDARARIAAFAAAVLVEGHGVVVAGRDLAHAYDGLERLEACARTVWLQSAAGLRGPHDTSPPSHG